MGQSIGPILTGGGNSFPAGDYMTSPNGLFYALLQTNGLLAIGYGASPPANQTILWNSGNTSTDDGNYRAVFIGAIFSIQQTIAGNDIWQVSGTLTNLTDTVVVSLQDDGQLVMLDITTNSVLWTSGTTDTVASISNVTAVTYDVAHATMGASTPQDIYSQTVVNSDPKTPQSSAITASSTITETSSWSSSLTVGATVSTSFETGIPIIAEGKVEVSLNTSYQYQWSGSNSFAKTFGFNTPVVVQPVSTEEVVVAITITSVTLPYATTCDVTFKSGNTVKNATIKGTYTGLTAHNLNVTFIPQAYVPPTTGLASSSGSGLSDALALPVTRDLLPSEYTVSVHPC